MQVHLPLRGQECPEGQDLDANRDALAGDDYAAR
jgi:hypothetical protein